MAEVPNLKKHFLELIRRASTILPADVVQALEAARDGEEKGSAAEAAFQAILENVRLAREGSTPVCQDTGTPIFTVHSPETYSPQALTGQIEEALVEATQKAYLRPNAVDSLTGKNSENNLGVKFPSIYFEPWKKKDLEVWLQLKGGGSENVSTQYAIPFTDPHLELKAGRDLEGVRRVVLHAVQKAQGFGCAPGVLGVAIGGDRGTGYAYAKKQLLRPLNDTNPNADLQALEERLLQEINSLGIGPMGFGGKTTVMGVKVGALHRLPASYFVSISYMCWANRRAGMTIKGEEVTYV